MKNQIIFCNAVLLSLTLSIFGLLSTTYCYGQVNADSTKRKVAEIITDRFPESRFLDVQFEQLGSSGYDIKDQEEKIIETGTLNSQSRFKVAMNLPLFKVNNFLVSTSLRYKYEKLKFEDVVYPSGANNSSILAHENAERFHYFLGSINFSYLSKLFGKPFLSNLSAFTDGSNNGFERLNVTYLGSLVLRRTQRTTMTLGVILQSNPNAISPVLPTFSYNHKFAASRWQLDVVLPKYAYVRRELLPGGRISLGTAFDSETFFTYPNSNSYPRSYNFNQNAFKSGVLYEYRLNGSFIATFKGGLNSPLNGQIREVGETTSRIAVKTGNSTYYNIGLSYNLYGRNKN